MLKVKTEVSDAFMSTKNRDLLLTELKSQNYIYWGQKAGGGVFSTIHRCHKYAIVTEQSLDSN